LDDVEEVLLVVMVLVVREKDPSFV